MRLKKFALLIFLPFRLLSFVKPAFGFTVDGFSSGMAKQEVIALVRSMKFDRINESRTNSLMAYDLVYDGSFRLSSRSYSFTFCNERLVQLQKNFAHSPENFTKLIAEYERTYGNSAFVHAESGKIQVFGESNSLSIFWVNGDETISVNFRVFPNNDQLDAVYEVQNKCFRAPVLR